MVGYIIRRIVAAVLVVVLISFIVFALFFLGPTNAAKTLCSQNGRCTVEKQATLEHGMGLDDNVLNQYRIWATGIFVDRDIVIGATYHCDAPCLGVSFVTKTEVRKQLTQKYPATLSLALGGSALYLLVGVVMGVLAAQRRGTTGDKALVTGSLLVSSIPYYVVALLSWLFLVNTWSVFPETGYFGLTDDPLKWAAGLLLPWLVLGVTGSTQYARFSRGAMVDALGEDYVRTATAKGVSARRVVFKHGLRAAVVPIATIFGIDFAYLLAGTVITEKIFDIDGIGRWGLDAIPLDFPVIAATVLFGAVLVVVANLAVDIIYSFLDPRVRLA